MTKIVDVREPNEFARGHVGGAVNIPLSAFAQAVARGDISPDEELVLYCNSGSRSGQVVRFLQQNGFTNVTNGINQRTVEQNFC